MEILVEWVTRDSPGSKTNQATSGQSADMTSSIQPFSLELRLTDAEAAMPSVETYPFD